MWKDGKNFSGEKFQEFHGKKKKKCEREKTTCAYLHPTCKTEMWAENFHSWVKTLQKRNLSNENERNRIVKRENVKLSGLNLFWKLIFNPFFTYCELVRVEKKKNSYKFTLGIIFWWWWTSKFFYWAINYFFIKAKYFRRDSLLLFSFVIF